VVSFLTGEPEYLDPLKEETPEGWIVTGYPWYSIKTPEHDAFAKAYQAKYSDYRGSARSSAIRPSNRPRPFSPRPIQPIPEKLIAAAEGLSCRRRSAKLPSARSTTSRPWRFCRQNRAKGRAKASWWIRFYRKGADYLPSDAEVGKLRPKE